MTASVVAIATVAIAALGGVLSLVWALVSRTNECADLREKLAIAKAAAVEADRDLDRLDHLYRDEVEKTAALVKAVSTRRANNANDPPDDPFALLDRLLEGWRGRTATAANDLRAERELRHAPDPTAQPADAGDGSKPDPSLPITGHDDEHLPRTAPDTPRALAAKDR